MATIEQTITDFWTELASRDMTGIVIAYSGGLDSSVLLYLCRQAPVSVRAIHVHHHLQAKADDWQKHCEQTAMRWQIPLTTIHLEGSPKTGESIEAWARAKRYEALFASILPGECLITAHHQDDQAETLLIQLCRGSGMKGLAAMPAWRLHQEHWHARPLLALSRQQLQGYAKTHALHYCDDPSNEDTRFSRNHMRHRVIPLLKQDFPDVQANLAKAAGHCAETLELLTNLAYADVPDLQAGPLDIRKITELSVSKQKNVLRTWLSLQGFTMPSTVHLQVILKEVMHSRYDKMPLLSWPGVEIRRYGYLLYAITPQCKISFDWTVQWNLNEDLELPGNLGVILVVQFKDFYAFQPLTVRFKQKGEKVKLLGHEHRKSLKQLFQEYRVPPWLRDNVPLIFCGDYLIGIWGYYQADAKLLAEK